MTERTVSTDVNRSRNFQPLLRNRSGITAVLAMVIIPANLQAFGGFSVTSGNAPVIHRSSTVVLMREGRHTVMTLLPSDEQASQHFVLVVPVPASVRRADISVVDPEAVLALDRLASPRLVELWEADPCGAPAQQTREPLPAEALGPVTQAQVQVRSNLPAQVHVIEGGYEITLLSATESASLGDWLRSQSNVVPAGLPSAVAPHVREGMRFVVARLALGSWQDNSGAGRRIPALRIAFDGERFALPVRLTSLIAPRETGHDLVIHVLSRSARFDVANRLGEFALTNQEVREPVRSQFSAFYRSVLDRQLAHRAGTVLSEYAWSSSSCDACPGPALTDSQLSALGADVIFGTAGSVSWVPRPFPPVIHGQLTIETVRAVAQRSLVRLRPCLSERALTQEQTAQGFTAHLSVRADGSTARASVDRTHLPLAAKQCLERVFAETVFPPPSDGRPVELVEPWQLYDLSPMSGRYGSFIISRMHTRMTDESPKQDLIFREAPAVMGGRENRDQRGILEVGASTSRWGNAFQTRFVIRHPWTQPMQCAAPHRGVWSGVNPEGIAIAPLAATNVAASDPVANAQSLIVPRTQLLIEDVADAAGPAVPVQDASTEQRRAETVASVPPASRSGCSIAGDSLSNLQICMRSVSVLFILSMGATRRRINLRKAR